MTARLKLTAKLFVVLCLIAPSVGYSHLLKVFAYAEGESEIHGYVYFAGGGPAPGAKVVINQALSGEPLTQVELNEAGEFVYQADQAADYEVVANTGDGHLATWNINKSDFAGEHSVSSESNGSSGSPPDSQALEQINNSDLAKLVERAVAKQVGPLRAELQASEERARFSDIMGGIGFIFGLSGVLLWWRSKE
ncbi:hypothetical protein [Litoribacillus peritrichatus]|uniref:Nickel transport protein n=1 Tax=Litoribacillus peritrichatus TaxID=718191 RepID=A0ABP7MIG6_9GAMM